MAAATYNLFIPRANFVPGHNAAAIGMLRPGEMGQKALPTEAQMAGTRPPFVIDATLWSALVFKANSPFKTTRQVQIIGDAAWAATHYPSDAAYAAGYPVAANVPFTVEITAEDFALYVAAATGTVNLHVYVVR